jgi:hypothetical protein
VIPGLAVAISAVLAAEMADDLGPEAVVNAFLQHKSLEQMQDYLARGIC